MVYLAFAESIQLVPDGTLFIHVAVILLMLFILNRTLFRPINRIIEERELHTHGRTDEARATLRQVDANLARYENALREARVESYRKLERSRAEAMAERQRKIEAAREEVGGLLEEQKRLIAGQAGEARASLEGEARRVASIIGAQILGRPVGDAPQPGARI